MKNIVNFISFCLAGMLVVFIFLMLALKFQYVEEQDKKHREYIGRKIEIGRDTFIIVDWNSSGFATPQRYILSNGVSVDENFVYNNIIE